ncbi:MAG: bifunctional UDP-N-acetylmuramoyl-tripeptide:D-alanyl-D-alanine ligase/alanine racemase [Bacteroidota bacterium]|nr:bifunctional UDP-N-acetylmuramoyl-tripeptide:D-alanyl-D-alanine ligase/alanine racemase [Bacteroidota bacterium]
MNISLSEFVEHIPCKVYGDTSAMIKHISIDSRSSHNNKHTLFFALKGKINDGHHYIEQLVQKGVQNFVVSTLPKGIQANFILVDDTLKALHDCATYYRNKFDFPIIGITGSNGKTIVKEWINTLLSSNYNIIRSPKSYNSQVGVPLSIFGIDTHHNLGIFEAGISERNEMQHIASIISPNIGILTNIGDAHNQGFNNIDEKISEKIKLFDTCDTVIYKYDTRIYYRLSDKKYQLLSWSFTDPEALILIEQHSLTGSTLLEFSFQGKKYRIDVPFLDKASIENATHCIVLMLHLGYQNEEINTNIKHLFPIEMRLEVKNGINNTTIIDDSYICDMQSLHIALDFLEQYKQHPTKMLILSDIDQKTNNKLATYHEVKQLSNQYNINSIIGIGNEFNKYASIFDNITTYKNTSDFIEHFDPTIYTNHTILVKGARRFRFEKIVHLLQEKSHQTVMEINLNSLIHNFNHFKSKLKPTTKMMVMIKAFAYGSGSVEIAKLLEHHKTDYLGVAFTDEGVQLRKYGINLPIIVMNPEASSFDAIIHYNLEPEIYSLRVLSQFKETLALYDKKNYPIHLKLDTGMHRLGFEKKDIEALIRYLSNYHDFFDIKSIFSHLSASDDSSFDNFTEHQYNVFTSLANTIKHKLQINPILHISNTSAIIRHPQYQLDMVRLGIGLYGISSVKEELEQLENVNTLKSVILQIKTLDKGESIGYSRAYIADKTIKIATIAIGYADGIPRGLSMGVGQVMVNNSLVPIVGKICMDMLMIDVSGVECHEGDQVIIFGKNPTVIDMADKLNSIPYEILSRISQRVKRVFYSS